MGTPRLRLPAVAVVVACCANAALPAQNESRGLLAGAAVTVLVDGGSGANVDSELLFHRNGFAQLAPQTFPNLSTSPDLAAILAMWGAPIGLGGIDVDDISTGRDEVLVADVGANAELNVPANRWSVWSFSLTTLAQGASGSRIRQEAMTGSVGAALFSFVLPNGVLPPQVTGITERSHSRRELGLGGGPGTEVDGIDLPLTFGMDQGLAVSAGLIAIEPNFAPLLQPQAIYFTVSHATRNLVPTNWWGNTPPSGATILRTTRGPIATLWSQPQVFVPFFQLALGQDEDIDALAYDQVADKLLFSTTGTLRDQFLFVDLSTDGGAPKPVMLPNGGGPLSQAIGKAQNDDIDAVCTLDPQRTTVGGAFPPAVSDDFGNTVGAPIAGLLGVPTVSGSAYRRYQAGQVHFDTYMVGWPPNHPQMPGFAAAFLTTGNNLDPVLIGGVHLRNPANLIPGDPQSEQVVVPPALALHNMQVVFRWVALDLATGALAEAWPVAAFL